MHVYINWLSNSLARVPFKDFCVELEAQRKQWETLFLGAPESLQMVTAAMKLKDVCSLEEKLWPTKTAY